MSLSFPNRAFMPPLIIKAFLLLLFLDATKAFDCVHHGILCDKLYNYGIRGPFLSLLTNYLADRSQTVVIEKLEVHKFLCVVECHKGLFLHLFCSIYMLTI